jgi:DNA gyrase/topoisomerase IV subunit A
VPLITPEKISEWMKEVEERPESAQLIVQQIANRLSELISVNETLLEENIALKIGERVEEYEKRIAHLEYQLNLLKRQFGEGALDDALIDKALPDEALVDVTLTTADRTAVSPALETISVLVYNPKGRVLRLVLSPETLEDGCLLGHFQEELAPGGEPPRILVTPSTEELLFVYTTGRVTTRPVTYISPVPPDTQGVEMGGVMDWERAPIPEEPPPGEELACLVPISKMALAEVFLQVSRRGCVKKILISMAESILSNQFIGRGVKQQADQILDLILCGKDDQVVLISQEGYLLRIKVSMLSYSIEDAMRLGLTDHLVAAFEIGSGRSILVMTQVGKVIHRMEEGLKTVKALPVKGHPVYSAARRKGGVRVVGAAAVSDRDWGLALHQDGQLTCHSVRHILDTGMVPVEGELLAFTTYPVPAKS